MNSFSVGRNTGASTRWACCPSLGNRSRASIGPRHDWADDTPEVLGEVTAGFSSLIFALDFDAAFGWESERERIITMFYHEVVGVR